MKRKILCVAVHPDDETLGAGGSLLKWKLEGHEIHWLILTKIDLSQGYSAEKIAERNKEIEVVSKKFNFNSVSKLDFLTTKLDEYPISQLVGEISKVITALQPDTLIIPHRFDAHSDHRKAYEALIPFTKSFRYPYVTTILTMETLSETGYGISDAREAFVPNLFIDISSTLKAKIEIMKEFKSELGVHPFPRSELALIAQANLRGSFINAESAEAFQIIKMVN